MSALLPNVRSYGNKVPPHNQAQPVVAGHNDIAPKEEARRTLLH
jgi:hypothetical protein